MANFRTICQAANAPYDVWVQRQCCQHCHLALLPQQLLFLVGANLWDIHGFDAHKAACWQVPGLVCTTKRTFAYDIQQLVFPLRSATKAAHTTISTK
jgi:hypothetical protein